MNRVQAFLIPLFTAFVCLVLIVAAGDIGVIVSIAIVALVVVAVLRAARRRAVEKERQAAEAKRRDEEIAAQAAALKAQEQRERAETERLRKLILANEEAAVAAFERMSQFLSNTASWIEEANRAYSDRAYSPFWSAVEMAFGQLAGYAQASEEVANLARVHAEQVEILVQRRHYEAGEANSFPVQMNVVQISQYHSSLLNTLDGLVYQAQRDETFALIWEQRRTTAAIVAGFRTMEDVIKGMRASISAAIANLGATLDETNGSLSRAVLAVGDRVTAAGDANSADTRELARRASEIRDKLYYPHLTGWRN